MAENLTVDNFVQEIKAMNERERARLRADKLIQLIIQLPDATTPFVAALSTKVDGLVNLINLLDTRCNNNTAEIIALKETNKMLKEKMTYWKWM